MRGKLFTGPQGSGKTRITPADAGKTIVATELTDKITDHPRGCGENTGMGGRYKVKKGSPPRMRGKLSCIDRRLGQMGITPADAGKTINVLTVAAVVKDHPRGCGENAGDIELISVPNGSPPRMRGKRWMTSPPPGLRGITPADAGKTYFLSVYVIGLSGSPPRMRGKLGDFPFPLTSIRITPADAGKTT